MCLPCRHEEYDERTDDGTVVDEVAVLLGEDPEEIGNDGGEPESVTPLSDDEVLDMLYEVAAASYHAARYRGQFRADDLEPTQEAIVEREVESWWEKNKHRYND